MEKAISTLPSEEKIKELKEGLEDHKNDTHASLEELKAQFDAKTKEMGEAKEHMEKTLATLPSEEKIKELKEDLEDHKNDTHASIEELKVQFDAKTKEMGEAKEHMEKAISTLPSEEKIK